jgi:hypothetical protein
MIKIRFVTCTDFESRLIRMQAGVSMPFTPSHTEALSQDGKSYIGARFDGGVQPKPIDYDAGTIEPLAEGGLCDRIVELPCTPQQEFDFYTFVTKKIGEPYDWKAIFGFEAPDFHTHLLDHVICSAFMTAALRACNYFPMPLTVPFHHITPRDLLLMLSSHVEINH